MRGQQNNSYDSKNQFINQSGNSYHQVETQKNQKQQFQKMFFMFQKMATDPTLFMKMMSSVKPTETEPETRRRQFQVEQHKYRNHEISPRKKDNQQSFHKQQSRVKGRDVTKKYNENEADKVLQRYLSNHNQKQQNLAESNITVSTKQQHFSKFQDQPIRSAYVKQQQSNNFVPKKPLVKDQISPQNPKFSAEDQRPINPARGYNFDQINKSIVNNSSLAQQPVNPSKYIQAQQRPIKGIQGDFKNFIMKQQGFPMTQFPDESKQQYENQDVPRAKPFLKRGSRQHLSSAIDKSTKKDKVKVKPNNNVRDQLNLSKSNVKEGNQRPERSISQNRVLGRKSISSKSITKKGPQKPMRPNEQRDKKTLQNINIGSNYTTVPAQGSKTPRSLYNNDSKSNQNRKQNSPSPTFQHQSSKQRQNVKKKNIFEQQSSDEQGNDKSYKNSYNNSNKNEVIPGVFLTKKELHQILTKYSKSSQSTTNNSETQIQELKSKYIDLCNILTQQKQIFELEMQKQRDSFEAYKQNELQKIKNEKKVQQRNMMNNQKNKQKQKQKEQYENLKKTLQKQREQFKHKQKNYRIMVEKYKKLAQQKERTSVTNQSKQQRYGTYDYANKYEQANSNVNTGTKQKKRVGINGENYSQSNEVGNISRGAQQNIGFNNRSNQQNIPKQGKQKEKQKLPNYQDLKKSSLTNAGKSQIAHQNIDKNKKYEYYEQFQNKQTVKNNEKYHSFTQENQQKDLNSDRQEGQETEQIVQYNPTMKLSDLTKINLNIKMVTDQMIQNLFRCQHNPQYRKYLQLTKSKPRTKIHSSRNAAEKKTTNVYADGGKQVIFDTGVRKQYFNNGYVIIFFANGDIKQKLPDQTVLYFYRQKQVDQITLPNKINIYRFDNNQVQFHFEDQSVQIRHPDGTYKVI